MSSFGFAGNNGHVILQAYSAEAAAPPAAPAPAAVVAPAVVAPAVVAPAVVAPAAAVAPAVVAPVVQMPTRVAAAAPKAAAPKASTPTAAPKASAAPPLRVAAPSSVPAIQVVWKACADIGGGDAAAQPEPDTSLFDMGLDSLGLAELVIQLEEVYGEGCITVDDILAAPTLREVASLLPSRPPTPPNQGSNDDSSRLAASFVSDLSGRNDVRSSALARAQLWRVRNSGNVPWPPGTQITFGGEEGGGLPDCNLNVPSSRAAAVLPGEEVDVGVAYLHAAAPTATVKSGPLLKAAAPPSTAARAPPKQPSPATAAPHRAVTQAVTPLGSWANTARPPAVAAYSPTWAKDARFTPAAAATPVVGTPVANGPLDAGVSAAVVERLAKMEVESRELRELVMTLAASPGGIDFGAVTGA